MENTRLLLWKNILAVIYCKIARYLFLHNRNNFLGLTQLIKTYNMLMFSLGFGEEHQLCSELQSAVGSHRGSKYT